MTKKGAMEVLISAFLFGAGTPVIKLFFKDISPVLLAGLLNLGSGVGLVLWLFARKIAGVRTRRSLKGKDWSWLAAATITGGIIAPVLMMTGLAHSTGSAASLLLNTEAGFSALLAGFVFKERLGARVWLGLGAISLGGVLITWSQEAHGQIPLSGLAIAGACLMWGFDNNFTRKISDAEPAQIASLKGLVAGVFNIALGLALKHQVPGWPLAGGVMLLGFFSYGISLLLFLEGLREIGTGRTAAYFATAPFVGAALSILILPEPLTVWLVVSAALMVPGVWLLLTEGNEHEMMKDESGGTPLLP